MLLSCREPLLDAKFTGPTKAEKLRKALSGRTPMARLSMNWKPVTRCTPSTTSQYTPVVQPHGSVREFMHVYQLLPFKESKSVW